MPNEAGSSTKQLSGEAQYFSFRPTPLQNIKLGQFDSDFLTLLAKTNRSLSQLNTLANQIPDIDLFVSMYVRKESLLSSQIEGTQATLDDILDPEVESNQNMNVAEVLNYIKATNYAIERLETLPLCNRFLRETHKVLMAGLRGGEKSPGEFRTSQNWIGPQNSNLKTATYIPPSPEDMIVAMSDFEKYINDPKDNLDYLIKIALIHYQFETIHPFLDGNGRIGRLLIALYLRENGLLQQPVLYISYFLKLNQIEYYDRLTAVRERGDYHQWIQFFIQAVHQTSLDATETIEKLVKLRAESREKVATLGRSAKSARLVYDYLERSPIIDIGKTSQELKMSFSTVSRLVDKLCGLRILKQTEGNKRNRCFSYNEYLTILRKDT